MVFTKTTYNKDLDAALADEGGVAILSILLNDDEAGSAENWFTEFATAASSLTVTTSTPVVTTLVMGEIIDCLAPNSAPAGFDYYFYVGSYNKGTCNPGVFWVVAYPPISIQNSQVKPFKNSQKYLVTYLKF